MKKLSLVLVCFICVSFLFVSCGKDKTIEKIIYGEPTTNGDNGNNNSNILSEEQFNSLAISREFNSYDDFYNYVKQCFTNNTDLTGIKFKIKSSTSINDVVYKDNTAYRRLYGHSSWSSTPYVYIYIYFLDFNTSYVQDVIFIANEIQYNHTDSVINIYGYSYQ